MFFSEQYLVFFYTGRKFLILIIHALEYISNMSLENIDILLSFCSSKYKNQRCLPNQTSDKYYFTF